LDLDTSSLALADGNGRLSGFEIPMKYSVSTKFKLCAKSTNFNSEPRILKAVSGIAKTWRIYYGSCSGFQIISNALSAFHMLLARKMPLKWRFNILLSIV